jgi:hypothetical protein
MVQNGDIDLAVIFKYLSTQDEFARETLPSEITLSFRVYIAASLLHR